MSTLAGRRGMRPKMMMPFDSQPPQRKLKASPFPSAANLSSRVGEQLRMISLSSLDLTQDNLPELWYHLPHFTINIILETSFYQ